MKKICISILANAGYSKEQVKGVTLRELIDFVNELLEYNDENTEVITINEGNYRGAKYGKIYLEVEEDEEEEEN